MGYITQQTDLMHMHFFPDSINIDFVVWMWIEISRGWHEMFQSETPTSHYFTPFIASSSLDFDQKFAY